MRSPKPKIDSKTSSRTKIHKKKIAHKQTKTWGLTRKDVSKEKIEDLNEVLRVHKRQKVDGRVTWKLVPKDSCEVYKARRRRQLEENQKKHGAEQGSLSEGSAGTRKKPKAKAVRAKKLDRRPRKKPPRKNKEYMSDSDFGSCNCSCKSMSSHSTLSISEMDYD